MDYSSKENCNGFKTYRNNVVKRAREKKRSFDDRLIKNKEEQYTIFDSFNPICGTKKQNNFDFDLSDSIERFAFIGEKLTANFDHVCTGQILLPTGKLLCCILPINTKS